MPLDDWIEARETASYFYGDKLLYWLEAYGARNGFLRDSERPGYDPDTDMSVFLREKAALFRSALSDYLLAHQFTIIDLSDCQDAEQAQLAIADGPDVLIKPLLQDSVRRVKCRPSFIIHRRAIERLLCEPPNRSEEHADYFILETRAARLDLGSRGNIAKSDSVRVMQAQMRLANDALAEVTGERASLGLVIGRGWKQTIDKEKRRGQGCLDKAGILRLHDAELEDEIGLALQWIRRVRREGGDWTLFPKPTIDELRPNTSSRYDFPWHKAKAEIAEKLRDPILLWNVGASNRGKALQMGVLSYDDPRASAEIFGVSPDKASTLNAILEMARRPDADIEPRRIESEREIWGHPAPVEFYVDFETVTDTDDDCRNFPTAGGQPLIFMVGCGHVEHGVWKFENFIAPRLTPGGEAGMINAWLAHMEEVRLRLAPTIERPICYHWSAAEEGSFAKQYSSARSRNPGADWPEPNWFDFLTRVFRKEPILVPGALGFGLKAIARAMFARGCIQVIWDEGPGDGLGAMVGAWRAYARCKDRPVQSDPAMQGIIKYNAIDCETMQQIIAWLRKNR